ncbi:MAG: Gfo/Idh/MocA family oxidoreductase [Planctomycetaceae bacterium]|nr:Gfo/Idh/MocA family oxidoreductase [Planctomycetaceae bacterium]
MAIKATRRDFLKVSAATGVGYWVSAGNQRIARADANSKLGVVSVGVGGKGGSDCRNASQFGDTVGVCDVDKGRLAAAKGAYPNAKGYTDFREMFTDLQDKFEVATISTPDHMHAPVTLMAMRMKKHCYTQKPLTRTIYEARLITEIARETGVCTQMGNQGSALDSSRMAIAQLKANVLGPLKAVYVWSNRPVWPQGPKRVNTMEKFIANMKEVGADQEEIDEAVKGKKKEIENILNNVEWNLWLGVAKEREFWPGIYHDFAWRSWWDFGTGALGDMACHQVTVPFDGCELKDPLSVQAKTSGHDFDSFPEESYIRFEFPETANRPAIPFYWYDRKGNRPPKEVFEDAGYKGEISVSGALIVGEKGAFYAPSDYCETYELFQPDGSKLDSVPGLEPTFAVDKGNFDVNNMYELFRAIEANDPKICKSNFVDRGGPLTETILLGNLAVWAAAGGGEGEKVEWDAKNLKVTNLDQLKTPGVADLVKPNYRGDYRLD